MSDWHVLFDVGDENRLWVTLVFVVAAGVLLALGMGGAT